MSAPDFDMVVCGGGMVGASLAALLATEPKLQDLRVALIEAKFPAHAPTHEIDIRVSAISRAAQRVLTRCGAWDLLPASQRAPYHDMVVWDAATPLAQGSVDNTAGGELLHFSASALGEPNLGHIIANNQLQWIALEATANAQVARFGAAVHSIKLDDDAAHLVLDDQRRISARLVVGADGAHSVSRTCVGINSRARPYQQSALVTHVRTARPHQQTAWQRFLPQGPIAFLPLNDGRSSIVWTVPTQRAAALLALDETQLASEISKAADHVLGEVSIAAPRAAFPLQLAQVDEYCRARFVLVGDAAHSVHPLAGQGVNLGLMDAAALVQVLTDARSQGAGPETLSELRVLRRYERWRKTENTLALGLMDGLNRLFSNANPSVGVLRRLGLRAVENLPIVKRQLMLRALGLAGDRPRIVSQP